jgi:hypothetical protein
LSNFLTEFDGGSDLYFWYTIGNFEFILISRIIFFFFTKSDLSSFYWLFFFLFFFIFEDKGIIKKVAFFGHDGSLMDNFSTFENSIDYSKIGC